MNNFVSAYPVNSGQSNRAYAPLSRAVAGAAVRIKRLDASPEATNRLRELGFIEGQPIKLLSRSPNLICQVCNTRMALSAKLAEAIQVEPLFSPRQTVA